MEIPDFSKFQFVKTDERKELSREIYEFFGKQISFGMLMNLCNLNGCQAIRECFIETQKSEGIKDRKSFFLWKVKNNSTKWG